MGGCTSSKMSSGEVTAATNDKRKGFSASSSMRKSSLIASESRLKNLAASDEATYEVVKGGRQASLPTDTPLFPQNPQTHSNEASSQTTSSQSTTIKVSRPNQFLTPEGTRQTTAPLATIETASELGTPTPMEENKSFSRSFLPQPGQQRPLLPPNGSLPRYGYSSSLSKLPALSSFVRSPSPLVQPSGVRQVPSPRPPGQPPSRMAVPPSTLVSQNKGDTDNVMISASPGLAAKTNLQLTTNGGIPRPGSGQQKPRLLSASGQKETPADSLKTSTNSVSGSKKSLTPSTVIDGSAEKLMISDIVSIPGKGSSLSHPLPKSFTVSAARPSEVPPPVPPAFKLGLRPPHNNSTTVSPRGPLAQAAMSKSSHTIHQPQKPVRKTSPGVSQLMATDSYLDDGQSSQEEMAGDGDRISHDDIKMFDIESGREKASCLPVGSRRLMNGRQHSESDYEDSNRLMERITQDGSVFSQGEALAELPLMYHIDEFSLDEMINAVRDVKILAHSLTTIPENTSFKMMNGHRNGITIEDNAILFGRNSCSRERLSEILKPPTKDVVSDPDATFRLIIDLQSALREALSSSHGS